MEIEIELDDHKGAPGANISITHNGNQWSTIRVYSQEEIDQLVEALQKFDGFNVERSVIPPHEQECFDLFAKYQQLAMAAIQDSARYDEQRAAWMREREELVEVLLELANAESQYRTNHDLNGDGSIESGRAWDRMRRAGNAARAAYAPDNDTFLRRYLRN
jgi:hypothetical protein